MTQYNPDSMSECTDMAAKYKAVYLNLTEALIAILLCANREDTVSEQPENTDKCNAGSSLAALVLTLTSQSSKV